MIATPRNEASMDGIQAYKGDAAPPIAARSFSHSSAPAMNQAGVKTTSHYFKALRRRFWVVLAVAIPVAIAASILILKQPPVYLVKTRIEISPPEIDPLFNSLVASDVGRRDTSSQANYVANREVRLRAPVLAERVVTDPTIAPRVSQYADPAGDLIIKALTVQQVKRTNSFDVSLEGADPALTARLLDALLNEFKREATRENEEKLVATKDFAEESLRVLKTGLTALDLKIAEVIKNSRTLGPGGRSILEEQYTNLESAMSQKAQRLGEISQQMLITQSFPKLDLDNGAGAREARLAQLKIEEHKYRAGLIRMKHTMRNFNGDQAAIEWAREHDAILDEIEELRSVKTKTASANPTEMILEQYTRELDADREERDKLLAQMRDTMPKHQELLTWLSDRAEKARQIARMEERLMGFTIVKLALAASDCVRIPASVPEPTVPTKPNKPILLALAVIASFGLGIGLVCLLEYIDHSVKVPEQVTHGLTLPLLGVVPRIRRTALTHRGGHLWTSGTPDSIESDAYRNVRASLLGIADKRGPIATLLITSAKAGEGKSTTALNLAATCARAGERTLLLDVDLRRPSLAGVFVDPDGADEVHGLVDVLRGELPWQRTVRHTEIANLDFIPTGDTGDIPIEILGTLELRQLLVALQHHYDRVILDGPAVLGLADCRVLGRIVDASLLVVRSGSHHLMTLHRAKAMLEQSHVEIAGVVFNGMTDDMNNWSSYGYEPLPLSGARSRGSAGGSEPLALAASR
jgi:polysaccharide biosynthesis transport protein